MAGALSLKDTYEKAGDQLQSKLREAQRYAEVAECWDPQAAAEAALQAEASPESGFGDVTAHMLKVIADAYTSQLVDPGVDLLRAGKRPGSEGADMNRIKAGILEEFEKSRDGYEKFVCVLCIHVNI